MAQFSPNPRHFDLYKNFKFRLKCNGKYVAGFRKMSALKRMTEPVEHREGRGTGGSRKSPGGTKYEAIVLQHGVTRDFEFEKWANKVSNLSAVIGSKAASKDFQRDITIEVCDETKQVILAYKVHRCWVSEYQALPDLDANTNAVAIQHIKIESEGWERDESATESEEQSP